MSDVLDKIRDQAPATEVSKNFGHYRDIARQRPVAVTSYGRPSVIMISAEEFARLKELDTRQAVYAHELPEEMAAALTTNTVPQASKAFNAEFKPR